VRRESRATAADNVGRALNRNTIREKEKHTTHTCFSFSRIVFRFVARGAGRRTLPGFVCG
jgi:hypothetical protein